MHEASGFWIEAERETLSVGRQLGRFNIVSKCKQHTEKKQPVEEEEKK